MEEDDFNEVVKAFHDAYHDLLSSLHAWDGRGVFLHSQDVYKESMHILLSNVAMRAEKVESATKNLREKADVYRAAIRAEAVEKIDELSKNITCTPGRRGGK